jgi:hypothetical protein
MRIRGMLVSNLLFRTSPLPILPISSDWHLQEVAYPPSKGRTYPIAVTGRLVETNDARG